MSAVLLRFEGRYEPELNSGCWLWSGATTPDGYGIFKVRDVCSLAHRASWLLFRGQLPACVCHRCDTPQCVNPAHLFSGDWFANNRDRHQKGRSRGGANRGERSPLARLSATQVEEIRASAGQASQRVIAARYGISQGHVSEIINGKKWAST